MNDRILWSIDHKLVTFWGIMRKVCGTIDGMILFGFGRSALRRFFQSHVEMSLGYVEIWLSNQGLGSFA